jgi:hypothetical protein
VEPRFLAPFEFYFYGPLGSHSTYPSCAELCVLQYDLSGGKATQVRLVANLEAEPKFQRLPEGSRVRALTRRSLAAVDADSGQCCIERGAAPAIAGNASDGVGD